MAVIPARGGSKRIPRKNIKAFCGKPVVAYSIQAAMEAGGFDRIIISSDDEEILNVGAGYGATPLVRPPELADDFAGTIPVIRHAVKWAAERGWSLDGVCCIYATAPFVRGDDIRKGWAMLQEHDLDFTFSATTFPYSVFRSLVTEGCGVRMLFPEHFHTRSQDLPEAIHDAGQFYWGRPASWLKSERIFGERAGPVMLPRYRVQDIDTAEDWLQAELIYQSLSARAGL